MHSIWSPNTKFKNHSSKRHCVRFVCFKWFCCREHLCDNQNSFLSHRLQSNNTRIQFLFHSKFSSSHTIFSTKRVMIVMHIIIINRFNRQRHLLKKGYAFRFFILWSNSISRCVIKTFRLWRQNNNSNLFNSIETTVFNSVENEIVWTYYKA